MKPLDSPSRLVRALPALAAILVFVRVLGAEFVYDDLVLLRDNPFLRNWSALWQGFDQPFWRMVGDDRIHSGFFRPLATASFTLLWKVGGGAPWVFHGASLLLHALASSMVAGLGLALGFRTRVAIFAGVVFAVHGAHAEPVAWASSLPDLLATVFCLASLLSWLRERSWMTAAWLLAALLTKESSIGILLLLVAHSLFQSIDRRKNLAPLLLVSAVIWLLRVRAWGGIGPPDSASKPPAISSNPFSRPGSPFISSFNTWDSLPSPGPTFPSNPCVWISVPESSPGGRAPFSALES